MSIKLDDYIEGLTVLADDLAGAGDRGNADFLSDVIKYFEDQKELETPKKIIDEGDVLRCPGCGHIVFRLNGRCWECGQRYLS